MGWLAAAWHRGWPLIAMVAGLAVLAPVPGVTRLEPVVRTGLTSLVGVGLRLRPPLGDGTEAPLAVAPVVKARLDAWGAPVRPPDAWAAGGVFRAVPLGERRDARFASLWTDAALEPDQPVVVGRWDLAGRPCPVLLGFTVDDPRRGLGLRPLTAAGTRLGALAGDPDAGRTVRFRAQGDDSSTLEVLRPEARGALRDGDLVWLDPSWASAGWTTDWSPPAGVRLFLGVLRIDPDEAQWHRAHRVEVPSPDELEIVAVRRPGGGEETRPQGSWCLAGALKCASESDRRQALWINAGRRRGVVRGLDVAAGSSYVGRVESAGWGTSRVRPWWCERRTWSVLVIDEEAVTPAKLRASNVVGSVVEVSLRPEAASRDGAQVVTAPGSRHLPAGLRFGLLECSGEGVSVRVPEQSFPGATIVLRQSES